MSATSDRDHVARIAATRPTSALRVARNIGDPWFRCQALAFVAWHTPDHKPFLARVAESLESAWSIADPNRTVTVAAWPVAALAKRKFHTHEAVKRNERELGLAVSRLIEVIAEGSSPASRADALLLLVHALSPFPRDLRMRVLERLVKVCGNPANRKGQRQIQDAALVVAADDPGLAGSLIGRLKDARRQRVDAAVKERSAHLGPRPFFE